MELTTIVIAGREYYLVPKEFLDPIIPVKTDSLKPEPVQSVLEDFSEPTATPMPPELATKEEQRQSIKIVTPKSISKVSQAKGGRYKYREKFLSHELTPMDLIAQGPRLNPTTGFVEDATIASMDSKNKLPPGKFEFYGPGIENDLGM